MNYGGNRRRNRRRYKIRYDRVIAVALVLIVLIVIITSCTKSCSEDKDKNKNKSQTSVVDELSTGAPVTDANGQSVTDPSGNTVTQPNVSNTNTAAEYTTQNVEYAMINNGDLVLVNSLYNYKFQPDDVVLSVLAESRNSYYSVKDNVLQLDSNVITQLNALMEAYATNSGNDHLRVISGYRTSEEQTDKYNSGKSKFPGGYSDYHTARTIDLGIFPPGSDSNYYRAEGNYAWLAENAASYGFVLRYPEGKETSTGEEARTYTYRYVGVPHAIYMKQNNLCLEEYIEQIKTHTNSNPLSVTNGATQYQVYYVAANVNNVTGVPVPSNLPYTISGNNVDGFIITVTIA